MEIDGSVESLDPEVGRKMSMKKEGSCDVVKTTNHTFGSPILLRGLRTRETKSKPMCRRKIAKLMIVEFPTHVTLECFNFAIELSMNIGMEFSKVSECFGFKF